MPPSSADQAAADNAHQDRAFEGDVGCVEVVHPPAHQHAQRDRRADDEDDLDLLAQRALLAEQQHAKAPRAHQHAADGRSYAQADQQGTRMRRLSMSQKLSVVGYQFVSRQPSDRQFLVLSYQSEITFKRSCHPERQRRTCYLHRRLQPFCGLQSLPCSALSASGAPPCAMSLFPPPRVPSFCKVCFISAPMSFASPGVCANTSDGCAPPQPRSAIHCPARVSFCASILMNARSRSGKNCVTSFGTRGSYSCRLQKLCCLQLGDFLQQLRLRLLGGFRFFQHLAVCSGKSWMWVEKRAAASVSVLKSRRAVATARIPQTNSTRTPCLTFSVLRSRIEPICPVLRTWVPPQAFRSKVLNVDQTQLLALRSRNLAHAHGARFVSRGEANLTGRFLEDDLVGQLLRVLQVAWR